MTGGGPPPHTVHATTVALGEAGVLIRGASGSGKTMLALSAIAAWRERGGFAGLVADDRTALASASGALIATSPPALRGLAELRSLAIVRVPTLRAARIRLVVDLVRDPERLPDPDAHATILGHRVPLIALPVGAPAHQLLCLSHTVGVDGALAVRCGSPRSP